MRHWWGLSVFAVAVVGGLIWSMQSPTSVSPGRTSPSAGEVAKAEAESVPTGTVTVPHAADLPSAQVRPSFSVVPSSKAAVIAPLQDADEVDPVPGILEGFSKAVESGDFSKIREFAKTDLAADGYVASGAIMAIASLAKGSSPEDRKFASSTLARWLKQESLRGTNDAFGNVTLIVEQLPIAGGPEAITSLIDALDSAQYPIFVETNIVIGLGTLGDSRAVPSVLRFKERLGSMEGGNELEGELLVESATAVELCLSQLGAAK